jgi:Tol biopolymer transport system component
MRRLIIGALAGLMALLAVSATPAVAKPRETNGQIVFARDNDIDEGGVLYTINPDGSHERAVLPLGVECPRWSPDGTHIATCGGGPGNATLIIDPEDGSYVPLPSPDPENLFIGCPVWSPDATRLACEGFGESDPALNGLYTIRSSDGGGLTRLTSNPGGDDLPGEYSPNGKRFVFARLDEARGIAALALVKVNGDHAVRQITSDDAQPSSGGDWSPQGNEIVFSRHVNGDAHSSLWVVHADGSGMRELDVQGLSCGGPESDPAADGCRDPHWSPDGTEIVFQGITADAGSNIYTVNEDGTGLTQITHGGSDNFPDWGTHPLQ